MINCGTSIEKIIAKRIKQKRFVAPLTIKNVAKHLLSCVCLIFQQSPQLIESTMKFLRLIVPMITYILKKPLFRCVLINCPINLGYQFRLLKCKNILFKIKLICQYVSLYMKSKIFSRQCTLRYKCFYFGL